MNEVNLLACGDGKSGDSWNFWIRIQKNFLSFWSGFNFYFFFTRNGCKQKRILKDDCVCVCVVSTFLFIEILSRVNVIGVWNRQKKKERQIYNMWVCLREKKVLILLLFEAIACIVICIHIPYIKGRFDVLIKSWLDH